MGDLDREFDQMIVTQLARKEDPICTDRMVPPLTRSNSIESGHHLSRTIYFFVSAHMLGFATFFFGENGFIMCMTWSCLRTMKAAAVVKP